MSIAVGLERQLCASSHRSLGRLRIIGACPFPTVTFQSFRSRRRIEPPRLHPSDGLVYFRRHVGGQSCHRLGRATIVSSLQSAGQSTLVDSIPDIGVETRHPCSTNPPIVSVVFLSSAQCFQPIGSKSRRAAIVRSVSGPGARLRGVGEEVSQVPASCFKIAPIGGRVSTKSRGCRGHPGTRRAAMLGRPHYKSESVVVATRRNQTSRQGTLMHALRLPATQRQKSIQTHVGAVPSCTRLRVLLCLTCVTVRYWFCLI